MSRRIALAGGTAMALAARSGGAAAGLAGVRAAASAVEAGELPGVVAVVWRKGEVVQFDTVGLRDIEAKAPMERGTIFRIASMSKPVTAALAMALIERGKLRLDAPITRWAPEFAAMRVLRRPDGPLDDTVPAARAITIEDLLTHRAGFAYGFLTPGPLGGALSAKIGMGLDSPMSPDAWMATLAALPLINQPGERFNYGHAYDVLGFVCARAAGTGLREVLRELVLGPCGMADTDFWFPPEKRGRIAAAYLPTAPGAFMRLPIPSMEGAAPAAYASGGQGLVSTTDDYLAFARMLLGGGRLGRAKLLTPESVRRMTANRLTPAQRQIPTVVANWRQQGFGFGMSIVDDAKAYAAAGRGAGARGAYGWPGAFGGWWQADPATGIILVWMQQVMPPAAATIGALPRLPGLAAVQDFQRQAYAALGA